MTLTTAAVASVVAVLVAAVKATRTAAVQRAEQRLREAHAVLNAAQEYEARWEPSRHVRLELEYGPGVVEAATRALSSARVDASAEQLAQVGPQVEALVTELVAELGRLGAHPEAGEMVLSWARGNLSRLEAGEKLNLSRNFGSTRVFTMADPTWGSATPEDARASAWALNLTARAYALASAFNAALDGYL